jgi:hypothetical protein
MPMVTATEMKVLANRWRRCARPLDIEEQHYVLKMVSELEKPHGAELAYFDDPLEAAAYVILVGILRDYYRARPGPFDP